MRVADNGLTFDDVLLVPDYSDVLPREVDLSSYLTREIPLQIPLLAAAILEAAQRGDGSMGPRS